MKRLIFLITALAMLASYAAVPVAAEKYDEAAELQMLSSEGLEVSAFGNPHPNGLTDEQSEELAKRIHTGLREKKAIDVSNLGIPYDGNDSTTTDAIAEIYANVIFEDPIIFYAETAFSYNYMPDEEGSTTGTLYTIFPTYLYHLDGNALSPDVDTINDRETGFEAKAQQIANYAKSMNPANEMEAALLVHDYLAEYAEYDLDSAANMGNSFSGHGADSLLIDKTAVCQGYSSAYKYILNLLGIECHNAYNNTDRHEWSIVKLDGYYYHVDVTFDDPTPDSLGFVDHELFALTDSEIIKHDSHSEWVTNDDNIKCSDTTYSDAEWKNTDAAVAFVGNDRYFLHDSLEESSYNVYVAKASAGLSEIVNDKYYTLDADDAKWRPQGSTTQFYIRYYTGLSSYGTYLYFNTHTRVERLNTASNTLTAETVYEISDGEPYIFGSYLDRIGMDSDGIHIYYADPVWTANGDANGTDNTKLHAVALQVTVTFEANGGTAVEDVTLSSGSKLDEPETARDSYTLEGWYTDAAFTEKWDFNDPVVGDMTLYARWTSNISLDAEPAVSYENGVLSGTVKYDISYGNGDNTQSHTSATVLLAVHENGILKQVISAEPISPPERYNYTVDGEDVRYALQVRIEDLLKQNPSMTAEQIIAELDEHKADIAAEAEFDGTIDSFAMDSNDYVSSFTLTASSGITIEYDKSADTPYTVYAAVDIAPISIASPDDCTITVYAWNLTSFSPYTEQDSYSLNGLLSAAPSAAPTEATAAPTEEPEAEPTGEPAIEPTEEPAIEPTEEPAIEPTGEPVAEPTEAPAAEPTVEPMPEATPAAENEI